MPRFSIVIAAYGNAEYLPACLESVRSQDYADWEAIVVVDASPDDCLQIAQGYAQDDDRFVVIGKSVNEGLHLARKTGVKACEGDFVTFLDADDELCPGVLSALAGVSEQTNADVVHFGIVCEDGEKSNGMAAGFEKWANHDAPNLTRYDALQTVFDLSFGYKRDWNAHHRLYRASLLKAAYARMTGARLERAEDGYEYLVVASLMQTEITRNDIVGYKYFIGRGVTSGDMLSVESFGRSARQIRDCYDAAISYAQSTGDEVVLSCAKGFKARVIYSLANEWFERVSDADKLVAADVAYDAVDAVEFAAHVHRFVRDRAYALLQAGDVDAMRASDVAAWYAKAKELLGKGASESPTYREYYLAARNHMADVRHAIQRADWDAQRVRIFVSVHKNVDLFDGNVLQPVQVGAAAAGQRFDWALHDDEGDNISELNSQYCELTAQYWAWKNVDAEYYGFCHYRRYFDFSDTEHEENEFGEVIDEFIDSLSQKRYALDDDSIRAAVRGFDVITTRTQDIRRYMDEEATLRSQYDAAPKLFVEDLDRVMEILVRRHPEYQQDVQTFLAGHTGRFCNMFIMHREVFQEYCAWLFPILEEFTTTADMSLYTKEGLRTPGHLSERLLNVFLLHHERVGAGWKMKELQCVHLNQPDFHYEPEMVLLEGDFRPVIPVAFAADNNYVPMLTTTMYSMMANASKEYRFEVVVLQKDIAYENRVLMTDFFASRFNNVSIQFCDVSRLVSQYELTTNNPHISVETYYRFLIQKLMPHYDKVLYLDSDLIVKGDVSELFNVDLGDNLLAAVRDIDFLGNVNMQDGQRAKYTCEVLGMQDPYTYFQAGVLVLNTRAMRELHPIEKWLEFASDDRFIYNDQDVLNAHCEGRVTYLPYDWNVMIDCANRIANVFSHAPAAVFDAFNDSRGHEKIVHYAGFEKPWKMTSCDRFELYWEYARDTPFRERLMALLWKASMPTPAAPPSAIDDHECAVPDDSPLRKIIDPIAPFGTARREVLKSIGRAVQGKK